MLRSAFELSGSQIRGELPLSNLSLQADLSPSWTGKRNESYWPNQLLYTSEISASTPPKHRCTSVSGTTRHYILWLTCCSVLKMLEIS
jgi:hypothetical protein